jgi:hypothetical protein
MNKTAAQLRTELAALRARYDNGAVQAAVYAVIRQLEIELTWAEHAAHGNKKVRFPISGSSNEINSPNVQSLDGRPKLRCRRQHSRQMAQ